MGSRWLVALVAVLVSLAISGGLLARDRYQVSEPDDRGQVAPAETTSAPLEEQPGSSGVQSTPDAARHPRGEIVRDLLQAHFDGINERDYQLWAGTVTADRVRQRGEADWQRDYRSTVDGSIVAHRIDHVDDATMRVLVSFTSTQDIADAPASLPEPCIRWWLALPIELEDGQWRIGTAPPGTVPEFEACS